LEQNIIVSYSGTLLGCIAKDNVKNKEFIRKRLPNQTFDSIILVLKEFIHFQSNLSLLTKETLESLTEIIENLKS
jgi:hypothetical protein